VAGRNSYDRSVERGIKQRHWNSCPAREGKRCSCRPRAYIASATVDGVRRYSSTLRDLGDARAWRARALAGELAAPDDAGGELLRETWRRWENAAAAGTALSSRRQPYRASTLADYEHAMREHVLPVIGNTPTTAITARHGQAVIDALAADGVSATRQASAATALRAVVRWAARRGEATPIGELELPRVPSRTPTVLGPAAIDALLAAVGDPEARALAAIAAFSGLRAMEIVALTADDVDHQRRTIRVVGGKTDAAARTVPIIDALRPHLAALPASGPVFAADRLPRSAYRTLTGRLNAAWADLEQPPTLHVLRHNFVSWTLAAGVPLPAVQAISGHRTPLAPGVTLGVYGHVVGDHVTDARERLDAWVAGQSIAA
jgi:integrase/recombinase XerC